jgi:hypothetical protein
MSNNADRFDDAMKTITQERGADYGHPFDDFGRVMRMKAEVQGCQDLQVRHALEMILVKVARLTETPNHLDSMIDIGGYARCIAMINDRRATPPAALWGPALSPHPCTIANCPVCTDAARK